MKRRHGRREETAALSCRLSEKLFFEKGAIEGRAAYAVMARTCLPHAAPVMSVRCTMTRPSMHAH